MVFRIQPHARLHEWVADAHAPDVRPHVPLDEGLRPRGSRRTCRKLRRSSPRLIPGASPLRLRKLWRAPGPRYCKKLTEPRSAEGWRQAKGSAAPQSSTAAMITGRASARTPASYGRAVGGRASSYPAADPRWLRTSPARLSSARMDCRNLSGIAWAREMRCPVTGAPPDAAISVSALTA